MNYDSNDILSIHVLLTISYVFEEKSIAFEYQKKRQSFI